MYRGIYATPAAVVAIALVITGCGNGSSSPNGGTAASVTAAPGLTKAEFIKEGNAICKRGSDQIHNGVRPFRDKHSIGVKASLTPAQEEEFVSEVVVPSVRTQAEGLARLGAPQGDLGEVSTIVERLERVAGAGEEKPASILQEGNDNALAEINKAAKAYGVKECMQP